MKAHGVSALHIKAIFHALSDSMAQTRAVPLLQCITATAGEGSASGLY